MTNIWVPKSKIIEPKREIALPSRMAGFFKLEAIRPDGRRRLLADWFPNLITNAGLNRIGTAGDWMNTCRVGSSSATPSILDTAMGSQIASASSQFSVNRAAQGSAPYFASTTIVYRFNAGVAEGNLAEIGIANSGPAGGGSIQFSRALILDGDGDPTVISVLEDEVLDATYQCRLYPPLVDVTGTINISGSDYDYVLRAMNVTSTSYWALPAKGGAGGLNTVRTYTGALGAITSAPGTSIFLSGAVDSAYGDTNYYRDATASWGLDDSNAVGGISCVSIAFGGGPGGNSVLGAVQVGFTPNIPKDNTMTMSLVFRNTWARHA